MDMKLNEFFSGVDMVFQGMFGFMFTLEKENEIYGLR